ncbi:methyltransferase domain-containing protein [Phyllobacterium sp. SYP-B3895]|uniref:methyltransferase domain-containing protein n=1 Tax=Phyllobacterium sp. SYP-B3895 TaxID=2663240 RepID=UPI0012996C0E|nr:methyltransferase domain-containing protein [Phyllobacterium sp. SYP-B3895]MRG53982.1 methyltransferase domain-containing protein [Phyllobacterium sp. SYP-B3895]
MRFKLLAHSEHQDWTGERFITDRTGEIEFEHHHRYLFATQFCDGMDVLDIASGEGYGSYLLSQVAKSVIGVDIDPNVVSHARRAYGSARLGFDVGSCQSIPLSAGSVDVVVSFETLEHINQHSAFLDEVKRVLRPGGLFVLSTPDRQVYSSPGKQQNPFHQLELSHQEFETLLSKYFIHKTVGLQKATSGSVIVPDGKCDLTVEVFHRSDEVTYELTDILPKAPYLIGLASDSPLPSIRWGLLDNPDFLYGIQVRLMETEALLQSEVGRLGNEVIRVNQAFEKVSKSNFLLNQGHDRLRRELQAERAKTEGALQHADELLQHIAEAQSRLRQILTSTSWKVTRPIRVLKRIVSAALKTLRTASEVQGSTPLVLAAESAKPSKSTAALLDPRPVLLLTTHDCSRTGAPVMCLNLARELSKREDVRLLIVAINGGELSPEFAELAPLYVLTEIGDPGAPTTALKAILQDLDVPIWGAICNTIVCAELVEALDKANIPVVSLVHELSTSIDQFGRQLIDKINMHARHVVYGSAYACDQVTNDFGIGTAKIDIIPTGHHVPFVSQQKRDDARSQVLINADPSRDNVLVVGCGTIDHRKGPDIFAQVASSVLSQRPDLPIHFSWIGSAHNKAYGSWIPHDVSRLGLQGRLAYLDSRADADAFISAADIFLLPSREDPYPLVNLTAMASGVPVIAFAGAGGGPEALGEAGIIVPYLDVPKMASAVIEIAEDPSRRKSMGEVGIARFMENNSMGIFTDRILGLLLQHSTGAKQVQS